MKSIAILLVGFCLTAGARAQTFAEVLLTHFQQYVVTATGNVVVQDQDLDFRLRVDTDAESSGGFAVGVQNLRVGEHTVTVYDYTITLSIRGLPYPGPRTSYCTPIAFESQCMEPLGAERTFAQILVGFVDPRGANPFFDISRGEVTLTEAGNQPQRFVQSGQLTTFVSTTSEFETDATFGVSVFVNVFAAPIPEVSTYASMLAGIALLAAATAWRRRGQSFPSRDGSA